MITTKTKDMSRPFVEFAETAPVILSCSEKKKVHLKVKPRVMGTCKVSLRLVMDGCQFGNGQQIVSHDFESPADDAEVNCVFNLFARVNTPGNYFTILVAEAQNAAGETSFQRPIELELHCAGGQLPPDELDFSNGLFTVLADVSEPAAPSQPEVAPSTAEVDSDSSAETPANEAETEETEAAEEDEEEEVPEHEEQPPPETTAPEPEVPAVAPAEEEHPSPEEAPQPEVVESIEVEMEETLADVVDAPPRVQPVQPEAPKADEPSGKSKPGGGCFGLLLALLILAFAGACKLENPELGISADEVITLSAEGDAQELLADGFSRLKLTAQLGPKANANEEITFFTEFGSFAEAGSNTYTVTASSKTATATLVAGTTVIEDGLLTASVGGFTAEYPIDFVRALPQDVIFSAGKLTLAADGTDFTNLLVELFREEGRVSDGARVDFSVEVLEGETQVLLVPFVYAGGTSVEVELRSANTEPGLLRITASTQGENGLLERSLDVVFE